MHKMQCISYMCVCNAYEREGFVLPYHGLKLKFTEEKGILPNGMGFQCMNSLPKRREKHYEIN